MKITVMTLFPEMIDAVINCSILGRARQKGLIEIEAVNIRDFANNKHLQVDDYPYGGGAGMLWLILYVDVMTILRSMLKLSLHVLFI